MGSQLVLSDERQRVGLLSAREKASRKREMPVSKFDELLLNAMCLATILILAFSYFG